ncbi:MAG: type II toxin-antitoxin system HicB family antitoxin [Patescibacteria group bacterium]|nr:type II toxin-antitoxin system HicB family antitoxin [Patescibacteria group bacterium]
MLKSVLSFIAPKKDSKIVRVDYGIPEDIKLNIRLTDDGYFVVTSPDLPGLITQAKNGKELLNMVNDAVLTYFDVPRNIAKSIFNTIDIDGYGKITCQKAIQQTVSA